MDEGEVKCGSVGGVGQCNGCLAEGDFWWVFLLFYDGDSAEVVGGGGRFV
jgi:hypothetical protein